MSGLVPVKLLRPFASYNKDEVVGFHKERAEAMVKGGVAEFYKVSNAPAVKTNKPSRPVAPQTDASDTF